MTAPFFSNVHVRRDDDTLHPWTFRSPRPTRIDVLQRGVHRRRAGTSRRWRSCWRTRYFHYILGDLIAGHGWREGHVIIDNQGRTLPYDHDLMNKAMDYRINAMLIDGKIGTLPKEVSSTANISATAWSRASKSTPSCGRSAKPSMKSGGQGHRGSGWLRRAPRAERRDGRAGSGQRAQSSAPWRSPPLCRLPKQRAWVTCPPRSSA